MVKFCTVFLERMGLGHVKGKKLGQLVVDWQWHGIWLSDDEEKVLMD